MSYSARQLAKALVTFKDFLTFSPCQSRVSASERGQRMKMNRKVLLGLCILVMGIGGCAETRQVKGDDIQTGFLGPSSSLLKPGKEGEANLVYMNPKAKWAQYDKIMLEPVSVWIGKGREAEGQGGVIPPEDLKRLANLFYKKLSDQLSQDYSLVQTSGPGVMRLSLALTDVEHGMPLLDSVTTVLPIGIVMTAGQKMAGKTYSFVGKASLEGRIVDSQSGMLLGAGIDRRMGGKKLGKGTGFWRDAENIFDYWAAKIRWRLCHQRKGKNCQAPEE